MMILIKLIEKLIFFAKISFFIIKYYKIRKSEEEWSVPDDEKEKKEWSVPDEKRKERAYEIFVFYWFSY